MEESPLAFVSNRHHPSEGALTSIGGGGGGVVLLSPTCPLLKPGSGAANNGILDYLQPSSPVSALHNNPTSALSLSTYTAGEDAGRLAMLAKELGLARTRPPKRQIRKHSFKAFLRNHPNNLSEDILQQPTEIDSQYGDDKNSPSYDLPASSDASSPKRHSPLRFVFSGYSLWLELEQKEIDHNGRGDLDRAMIDAADRFHLGGAIPSPHVTALYGIDTVDEEAMRRMFREDVKQVLLSQAEERRRRQEGIGNEDGVADDGDSDVDCAKLWPDLMATGIIVGAEFDGVDGGTMDMAWAEVSFATSPEHEMLINALYDMFYRRSASSLELRSSCSNDEEKKDEHAPRSGPWVPHLSLCYDNPEGFGPILSRSLIEKFMKEECPTLKNAIDDIDNAVKFSRAVSGISLWRTAGTMDEWECLERYEFPSRG
mmetsp:Transcript_26639/g.63883  ORF Transcript_26639/g.63883 Transcript_26639/m.63883 type:complete len:428 (-) Transcript_26639:3297-4580(-)